jgi:prophage antirepressor-like protein/predicted GIY-YIG superfamily endonuclease
MANTNDTSHRPVQGKKRKYSSELAYVYVIQDDNGLIKIGHSENPTRRLKQIQRTCGFTIVHRHLSPLCYNFAQVEEALQAEFGERLKQEEYVQRASFEEVCEALDRQVFQTELPTHHENDLLSFLFKNYSIRVVLDEKGKSWFVAKDVCKALDIVWKGTKATLQSIPESWRVLWKFQTPLKNQHGAYGEMEQELIFINLPAVYKLAFRSNKKEADNFTNWVAGEVLPKIFQQGYYNLYGEIKPSAQSFANEVVQATLDKVSTALASLTKNPVVLVETQKGVMKKIQVSFHVKLLFEIKEQ